MLNALLAYSHSNVSVNVTLERMQMDLLENWVLALLWLVCRHQLPGLCMLFLSYRPNFSICRSDTTMSASFTIVCIYLNEFAKSLFAWCLH